MAEILIVDDSKPQAKAIALMLERNGHDAVIVDNGRDGIELAKKTLPNLVLMDVVMPDLNGFQATREITRNPSTEHIPVVLVSGKSQETDRLWGTRQGAKGYLVKPIDETVLMETIEKLIHQVSS
jgi:twitching motility two-component system response regulator PilH